MVNMVFLVTNTPLTLKCGYYVNLPEGILKHKCYKIIHVSFKFPREKPRSGGSLEGFCANRSRCSRICLITKPWYPLCSCSFYKSLILLRCRLHSPLHKSIKYFPDISAFPSVLSKYKFIKILL